MPHAAFPFVAIHPLWGIARAAFTFRPLLTNSAIQHSLILSWSVSYGGEGTVFVECGRWGWEKGKGMVPPFPEGGGRLVSSLLSHWLCTNRWQGPPLAAVLKASAPRHPRTMLWTSSWAKKTKGKRNQRRPCSVHFSLYLSPSIVTFTWMTILNFLQHQTFCAWPHCLVTLLRLPTLLCHSAHCTNASHPWIPSVGYPLFLPTHHQQSRLATRNL